MPEELWDKTEQMERHKRTMLLESRQPNVFCTAWMGKKKWSHLIRTESPRSLSRVRGKGKEYMQSPAVPFF